MKILKMGLLGIKCALLGDAVLEESKSILIQNATGRCPM
jgi:hypothetical protein